MKAYPHELSGGMRQRVMIAIALSGRPRLLLADEPTTALDVTIQDQILVLLREIRDETGMSIVLVSHDMGVIAQTCDRVAVMYAGHIVEVAPVGDLFARPEHPYTQALLAAMPRIDGGATRGSCRRSPVSLRTCASFLAGVPSRRAAPTRARAASWSPWSSSPSGSTTSRPVRSCGRGTGRLPSGIGQGPVP